MLPEEKKLQARKAVAEYAERIRKAGGRLPRGEEVAFYQAVLDSKDVSEAQEKREAALPKGWGREFYHRAVLPPGWAMKQEAEDAAVYMTLDGLVAIVSAAVELDGLRWLHMSCSRADKLPSWLDLRSVKDLFVGVDKVAIQVLPKQTEFVNIHPRVLHLFSCLDDFSLPDFTRGTGSL